MSKTDAAFSTAIAEFYDRYLGEPHFGPHAESIVRKLRDLSSGALLEIASGTGILTAMLAQDLPPDVAITATDLNQPMLDVAATKPGMDRVAIRQANAMELPFPDAAFDAVICQFGVMFFPDRPRAHAEAHRVLQVGGRYVFNTWDEIAANPATEIVDGAVASLFPDAPPRFLSRTPWGYHDQQTIRADLRAGGFAECDIEAVPAVWNVRSVRDAARALCQGTPLRAEIEARDAGGLQRATDTAAEALASRFGNGPVALPTRSLLIEARH